LEDPTGKLTDGPGEPYRAAQDLDEEAWVVASGGSFERPFLLKDIAECEGARSQKREENIHRGPVKRLSALKWGS